MLLWLANIVFVFAVTGILLVAVGNPLSILLASLWKRRQPACSKDGALPRVSIITVAHRPGPLLPAKLSNSLALEYPPQLLECIYVADGEDPDAMKHCNAFAPQAREQGVAFRAQEIAPQRGKNACLNDAVAMATGEILIFTDVDAALARDAVRRLVPFFAAPSVGGVGGRRVLAKEKTQLAGVQSWYWKLDAWIKTTESSLGSVTANDGKLYAIRRALVQHIPDGVTDDLYNCLTVLRQRFQFLYTPDAVATVPTPSRSGAHEVSRRRRIVCRGLRGLWLSRALLNPMKHGWLAVRLGINKVLRRLLPVLLVCLFISSMLLSFSSPFHLLLFTVQMLGYAVAMAHPLIGHVAGIPKVIKRIANAGYYICLGMVGTWLGLYDFIQGRVATRWTSIKEG